MAQLRELIAAGKSKFLGTSTFQGMLIVDGSMSVPGISSANSADYFLAKNSNDEVIYINKNNISVGTANALSTQNVGSNVKIIYWKDGIPVVSNGSVGGAAHPIYLKDGELTACSSDIGNGKQPVFMSAGVITPSTDTEGSASRPLYLKAGVLTPINQLAVANGGTGKASWTKFALVYASNTTELDSLGLGTSGYVLTSNGSTAKPSWTAPTTLLSNALAVTASGTAPLTLTATPTTTNGKTTISITGSVATATKDSAGVTIVYPAASCTTYTTDSGTVTPAAVKKAVTLFGDKCYSPLNHTHNVTHTPAGSVSKPTFTGTKASVSATAEASVIAVASATHSHKYTPSGSVSKPTFTGSEVTSTGPEGQTSVFSITGVGTLPSLTAPTLTMSVSNKCLNITFNAGSLSPGSLPTREEVRVASTGHTHKVTAAGTVSKPTFTGTEASVTTTTGSTQVATGGHVHDYTPSGTVSKPTFTGTEATITTTTQN